MKGKHHVYMEATPGASGSGAAASGAGAAAAAGAGEGGATAATGQPAGGAGSAGATPGGANTQAGGAGAATGSAIAAGSGATGTDPGAGAGQPGDAAKPWAFIAEKYQVKNEKGEVDGEASARKVAEAHANLEKRMGEGSARPKTAAEYKLPELPEALKDMPLDDAATNRFKDEAHKAGYSQAQFEFAMSKYFEMAPALVNAGQKFNTADTVKGLKESWGADYEKNAGAAWQGINQIAAAAGLSVQEVEAEIGNSPAFNRIMAVVGAQLKEDKSINAGGSQGGGDNTAAAGTIQASEEFRNPKHPGHAAAVAKWNKLVTAGVPDTPIL